MIGRASRYDVRVHHVLAYAKKPVGAVMMRPMLQRLSADPQFDVTCAVRAIPGRDDRDAFRLPGLDGMRKTPRWRARLKQFDVYLSADFGVLAPRSRVKVHTFHGVSFRNHAVDSDALRYDLLLVAGPYMRRRFEHLGILNERNADRFRIVGVPKLDALVNGSVQCSDVLASLGLDPSRSTILYAPTWSAKVSSLEHRGEVIVESLLDAGHNVIVKLHDNSFDLRKTRRDWRAYFRSLDAPRLRYVEEADIVPFMAAADALVSDASSVANEFCLLDRPILFMETEALASRLKPRADLETWGRKAGCVVADVAELAPALDRELADPGRLSEVRQALAQDLFHAPGRATDHAMRAIYDVVGVSTP